MYFRVSRLGIRGKIVTVKRTDKTGPKIAYYTATSLVSLTLKESGLRDCYTHVAHG